MVENADLKVYNETTFRISEQVTRNFSTSFYSATRLLDRDARQAIFSIYGFVRFADEIVDSFHHYEKERLLIKFEEDYYEGVKQGISLNPVLQSFQLTVKKYDIPDIYVQAFLQSMKRDLYKSIYNSHREMSEYIYGSADVVGLMCLKVFCYGNPQLFDELQVPAMKLGSAFQKVNFLRDLKNDVEHLDRQYFPDVNRQSFNENRKAEIISDIEQDFDAALTGIKRLPRKARVPVFTAYSYYRQLLLKISRTPASQIFAKRIRISNLRKLMLLFKIKFMYYLHLI